MFLYNSLLVAEIKQQSILNCIFVIFFKILTTNKALKIKTKLPLLLVPVPLLPCSLWGQPTSSIWYKFVKFLILYFSTYTCNDK